MSKKNMKKLVEKFEEMVIFKVNSGRGMISVSSMTEQRVAIAKLKRKSNDVLKFSARGFTLFLDMPLSTMHKGNILHCYSYTKLNMF